MMLVMLVNAQRILHGAFPSKYWIVNRELWGGALFIFIPYLKALEELNPCHVVKQVNLKKLMEIFWPMILLHYAVSQVLTREGHIFRWDSQLLAC